MLIFTFQVDNNYFAVIIKKCLEKTDTFEIRVTRKQEMNSKKGGEIWGFS